MLYNSLKKKESQAIELARWLNNLPSTPSRKSTTAKPVIVRIGRSNYSGAYYVQKVEYLGRLSYNIRIMLLGERRKGPFRRSGDFILEGELSEWSEWHVWHVAAYYEGEKSELQPFGANIILAPWEVPNDLKIDHYDSKKYKYKPRKMLVNWVV